MRILKSRIEALERAWSGRQARTIAAQASRAQCKLLAVFPDTGPHRRELYPRHMEFIQAGAGFRERLSSLL